MIEFKGLISGEAEKHFWNKEKKLGLFAFGAALALFTFIFVAMSIITGDWRFGIAMILMSVIIVVIILVYKPSKKQIEEFNPRRIYIDEDYLVMESLKGEEEAHPISPVRAYRDDGTPYQLQCSNDSGFGRRCRCICISCKRCW